MVVGENVADLVVGKGSLLIVRDGDRELGFGFPDFRFGFGEREKTEPSRGGFRNEMVCDWGFWIFSLPLLFYSCDNLFLFNV